MKSKLKVLILMLLIIIVISGIGYTLYNAIHSINYNKNAKNPIVTMDIEGYGSIKMELYPEYAPNTVAYFVKLVQKGYYNGKVFFGVDGSSVQGGLIENTEENAEESTNTSKVKTDTLKASYMDTSIKEENDYEIAINGEFADNGFTKNTLRFDAGIIGLYRDQYTGQTDLSNESYNSGKVRFFIETENNSNLNGRYAAFGKVVDRNGNYRKN